jgi:hypothetical protein
VATWEQLARRVPWREPSPRADLHGTAWSTVLAIWAEEAGSLALGGQPTRAFQSYAERATG